SVAAWPRPNRAAWPCATPACTPGPWRPGWRSGLAAVFGFLGLVAVVNTLGGLAVRALLGPGSTARAPAA
ncbi:MAG TPA: hypothetical protein VG499_17155, partial [Actinomycetota bacterium]|nr:hypothetical protein [Actinomycetota bacterium]